MKANSSVFIASFSLPLLWQLILLLACSNQVETRLKTAKNSLQLDNVSSHESSRRSWSGEVLKPFKDNQLEVDSGINSFNSSEWDEEGKETECERPFPELRYEPLQNYVVHNSTLRSSALRGGIVAGEKV